jgi:hypothetical protein
MDPGRSDITPPVDDPNVVLIAAAAAGAVVLIAGVAAGVALNKRRGADGTVATRSSFLSSEEWFTYVLVSH